MDIAVGIAGDDGLAGGAARHLKMNRPPVQQELRFAFLARNEPDDVLVETRRDGIALDVRDEAGVVATAELLVDLTVGDGLFGEFGGHGAAYRLCVGQARGDRADARGAGAHQHGRDLVGDQAEVAHPAGRTQPPVMRVQVWVLERELELEREQVTLEPYSQHLK